MSLLMFSAIEYMSESDMLNAIKKLDDTKLDGNYVRLYEAKSGASGSSSSRSNFGREREPQRSYGRSRSRSPIRGRSRSRSLPKRDRR